MNSGQQAAISAEVFV